MTIHVMQTIPAATEHAVAPEGTVAMALPIVEPVASPTVMQLQSAGSMPKRLDKPVR